MDDSLYANQLVSPTHTDAAWLLVALLWNCTDKHGPRWMNPDAFGRPLTFLMVQLRGWHFCFFVKFLNICWMIVEKCVRMFMVPEGWTLMIWFYRLDFWVTSRTKCNMSRNEPLYQLDGFVQIPIRMPITSLTFLHLHHDVDVVVHSEMSTCWMDNPAFLSFTFVTIVHGGWLSLEMLFHQDIFHPLDFPEECMPSWWYSLEFIYSGFESLLFLKAFSVTCSHLGIMKVFNGLPLSVSLLCVSSLFLIEELVAYSFIFTFDQCSAVGCRAWSSE